METDINEIIERHKNLYEKGYHVTQKDMVQAAIEESNEQQLTDANKRIAELEGVIKNVLDDLTNNDDGVEYCNHCHRWTDTHGEGCFVARVQAALKGGVK